jgi:hypothetical protein
LSLAVYRKHEFSAADLADAATILSRLTAHSRTARAIELGRTIDPKALIG